MGLELQPLEVRKADDFEAVFAAAKLGNAQALFAFDDALIMESKTRVMALAASHRIPAMYGFREFTDDGGLMSYGAKPGIRLANSFTHHLVVSGHLRIPDAAITPGSMLKNASRRKFDVVMAWAIDRLGRSLIDLLGTIQHLEAVGVDLYLDQQNIDTTPPTGKLLLQITGAFAEFERSMIRQRVRAGLNVVKEKLAREIHQQGGQVRRKLGRPGAEPEKIELALRECIGKVAKMVGLGVGTVHCLKREGAYATG